MSVDYSTVRVVRDYVHSRTRVFAAWADGEVKRQWFTFSPRAGDEWSSDFRVGGYEMYRSAPDVDPRVSYDAQYQDIVAGERIILSTTISIDGRRSSVTVNTAEFASTAGGTRLTVVDQAVFLDGLETADSRTGGISNQLANLASWLSFR
jgi:uncharacterized protein YndB with AHSA1/START domain